MSLGEWAGQGKVFAANPAGGLPKRECDSVTESPLEKGYMAVARVTAKRDFGSVNVRTGAKFVSARTDRIVAGVNL